MEMRIGSGSPMAMDSASLSAANQKHQHISNLFSALDSGDIASAQKSYSALGLSAGTTASNSPLALIGKALDSGDLSGAQQIAKSMKTSHAAPSATTDSQKTAQTPIKGVGDTADELLSNLSSASSVLGLGRLVNTLV